MKRSLILWCLSVIALTATKLAAANSSPALRIAIGLSEAKALFDHLVTLPIQGPTQRVVVPAEGYEDRILPWAFVADGCRQRAHLMAYELERLGVFSTKLFVHGRLSVPSMNSRSGACQKWSFHVAPVVYVKVDGQVAPYILDPSISDGPLPYREWIRQIAHPGDFCEEIPYDQAPAYRPKTELCIAYFTPRFQMYDLIYERASTLTIPTTWDPENLKHAVFTLVSMSSGKEADLLKRNARPSSPVLCED